MAAKGTAVFGEAVAMVADFMVLGMIMTAMPAINAIPGVVAAREGIVTYADLPLPLPRGLVQGQATNSS